ncbi:hypothetical protein LCGC14_2810590 [marine sediment metagenome]|uniref:Helix-turn-helix type 11 domain-containing protein n=2 Tax=marine sediment metagenome TaxID=412755 RepID=A0A0F8V9U9_9ZZZZ
MTLQVKNNSTANKFKVLNKYFRNKNKILVFIGNRCQNGYSSTVNDIVDEFKIVIRYAYRLLEELEFEGSIIKGTKMIKNEVYYTNYIITESAISELKEISRLINEILWK